MRQREKEKKDKLTSSEQNLDEELTSTVTIKARNKMVYSMC